MIYIHVPFCRSFCTYCDFYSEVALRCDKAEDILKQEALWGRYSEALSAEIRLRKDEICGVRASGGVNTLYIGGGTPSVLPLDVFRRLLDSLAEVGVTPDFSEFTMEVNPEDIVEKGPAYVEGLLRLGVNRVSMGIQSFDDGILKWMNRRHDSSAAAKAYGILETSGMDNISVDLIFGLPQLSGQTWRETLKRTLSISSKGVLPRHISSYQLSVEPGSMLARLVDKGMWKEASDDMCERQYMILCEELAKSGYHHYEISNFAQPGYEAVHNSAYWRHVPYVGLGPGAHSYIDSAVAGENVRKWNKDDLNGYIHAGSIEDFAEMVSGEVLDEEQMRMERLMLGLRTSAGLPEETVRNSCGSAAVDKALVCGDLVVCADGSLRIPEDRFFISDSIVSTLV